MKRKAKVLVVYASRHHATEEIASVAATELAAHAIDVTFASAGDAQLSDDFAAVVCGSAVYMGRWQATAKAFVETNAELLRTIPVWLFSSGPIGDPPKPAEVPVDGDTLRDLIGARDHKVFAGRLEKSGLSLRERTVVRAVKAPYGDYRDWDEIREWAARIAAQIVLHLVG